MMVDQRVLVLGISSPAAVATATRLGLGGASLTIVDEDLSAADRLVEALREQGCDARVQAEAPTDSGAIAALVGEHQIVIDTLMSPSSGGQVSYKGPASGIAYVRVRSAAVPATETSFSGFRAFVDLTSTPVADVEPQVLQPLLDAIGRATIDPRFIGHISVHASP